MRIFDFEIVNVEKKKNMKVIASYGCILRGNQMPGCEPNFIQFVFPNSLWIFETTLLGSVISTKLDDYYKILYIISYMSGLIQLIKLKTLVPNLSNREQSIILMFSNAMKWIYSAQILL